MNVLLRTFLTFGIATAFFLKTLAQPDTLSFIHISDIHAIFNPEMYRQELVNSRKQFLHSTDSLRQFLQIMQEKTGISMVIATGDLIDFYEAETNGNDMLDFQAEQFVRLLETATIPVCLVLGNHDISSYAWGDSVRIGNQHQAGRARSAWIRNATCFRDGTWYSRVFDVDGTSYRLIFLDNSYNSVQPGEERIIPYIGKSQQHWLKDQLSQSPDDFEIILMHLPLSGGVDQSATPGGLLPVLAEHRSAAMILAGHNHKNAIAGLATGEDDKLIQVQTGSYGLNSGNWRLIRLTKERILVSFPGKTDTELTIPVK